jgi:hypothetical protein
MTQQTETILTRKITGLTWGVVFAIMGTFGTGGIFIVRGYVNIQKSIDHNALIYDAVKQEQSNQRVEQENIKSDLRGINARVDMIAGKLIYQRTEK